MEEAKETPAETTAATTAPAAATAEEKEVTPASDGILGYKAPGLVK